MDFKRMILVVSTLIFVINLPLILGEARTTISCGTKRANLGEPRYIRCNIQGDITHGIKWYHGGQPIAWCDVDRNCTSSNSSLYRVSPRHDPSYSILGIPSSTQSDIDQPWTCLDSPNNRTKPEASPDTSTCYLKGPIVPTDLGCGLVVGIGLLTNICFAAGGVIGLICGLEPPRPVTVIVCVLAGIVVASLGAGSWYACKATLSTTVIGAINVGVWAFIIIVIFSLIYLGKKCSY